MKMTRRPGGPTFQEEARVWLGSRVETDFVAPDAGFPRTTEGKVDKASIELGEGEDLSRWRTHFKDVDVSRVFGEELQPEI